MEDIFSCAQHAFLLILMHVCCGDFSVDTQLLETCSSTSSSMSTIVRPPVHHGSDSNMSTLYCLHVSLDGTEWVFLWWLVCNADCAVMSAATLLASAACHGLSFVPCPCACYAQLFEGEGPKRLLVVWWRGVRGPGCGMLSCFGGQGNTDW